jgi:orotidine-5'-phosphate decarboxylase
VNRLPESRLIAAIDTADPAHARALITAVAPHCGLVKLGLEAFCANGPMILDAATDMPVFLDLKLHDIPATVAGAVRALLPRKITMLTVHAAGGAAMIEAACRAADEAETARPRILAVTVLTSLLTSQLAGIGFAGSAEAIVLRLARLALDAGADGLVCSAKEIVALRDAFGAEPLLIVPGIRPAGAALSDQARIATPEQAIRDGADYIVVGRPITAAADPGAAAAAIAQSIT